MARERVGEGAIKRRGRGRVLGEGGGLLGCFELSRAGGGVHSVVGEGQKGTGETGWLAGTRGQKGGRGAGGGGAGGREGEGKGVRVGGRVSRVVEHRGPLVVWDGKGRVDMGW